MADTSWGELSSENATVEAGGRGGVSHIIGGQVVQGGKHKFGVTLGFQSWLSHFLDVQFGQIISLFLTLSFPNINRRVE